VLFLSGARLILRWGDERISSRQEISEPQPNPAAALHPSRLRIAVVCVVVCSAAVCAERVLLPHRVRDVGVVGLVSVDIS
jgi:hypothetical protein